MKKIAVIVIKAIRMFTGIVTMRSIRQYPVFLNSSMRIFIIRMPQCTINI